MKIWGYCRISDPSQNLESQVDQLETYGVDEIVTETVIGVSEDKKLNDLIEKLNPEDTLVVTRFDRLGRSAKQLLDLVDNLEQRNVNLVFLDLNIDTNSPLGRFFLTTLAGFSELEREQLKVKQRKGIELAKRKGVYKGRIPKYTSNHRGLQHAFELYDKGDHTVREICEITKISKATLYRKLKERTGVANG